MSQRIRQLEDALAILQASISSESHDLLRDDLLSIKYGLEQRSTQATEASKDPVAETVDAFGTLTINGQSGESRYFGASAGSEVHLTFTALNLIKLIIHVDSVTCGSPFLIGFTILTLKPRLAQTLDSATHPTTQPTRSFFWVALAHRAPRRTSGRW